MPADPRLSTAIPSTSASPYDAPSTGDAASGKSTGRGKRASDEPKKPRLKACDACKLRRVLCLAKAPPASCPRCIEKGIVCTTTPVIRKKPTGRTGKRIEEARATFGTIDPDAPEFMGPSNTPWITPRSQQAQAQQQQQLTAGLSTSQHSAESRLASTALSGQVVAHLLGLYQTVPQSWLPLYPRGRIQMLFEQAGRQLGALAPQVEVLALTICAISARLSSHPAIVGDGASVAPAPETLTPEYLEEHPDLREFGRRREAVCGQLRDRAVRLSWERGTLVETTAETMACCFLLEMLEGRTDSKRGKPYGSAFVSHLRTILDSAGQPGAPTIMNMALGWSALIMREALYAANFGRTSHFTAADDVLLCGEPPASIEETLLESVESVDVRDSITLFFRPMRPYTYHVARLARECSDKVTGTYSRRLPLDERYVTRFLTQLDHLHALLSILTERIAFVLSPAATSAHALPGQFERERQYIMRSCLDTIKLAWCSLALPLYLDLKRRVSDLDEGPQATAAERRRTKERVELLLRQVHQEVLKAARMVAASVRRAPSLAFLTHLTQERLGSWVEILLEAKTVEEGGTGITAVEKSSDLQWMLDGLKTMGWSWTDDAKLIDALEYNLSSMSLDDKPHSTANVSDAPSPAHIDVAPGHQMPTSTQLPSFSTTPRHAKLPSLSMAIPISMQTAQTPPPSNVNPPDQVPAPLAPIDFSAFLNSPPAGFESLAAGAMAALGDGAGGFDLSAAAELAAAAGFDLSSLANMGMSMGMGMGMGADTGTGTGDFGMAAAAAAAAGAQGLDAAGSANLAATLNGLLTVPLFSPTSTDLGARRTAAGDDRRESRVQGQGQGQSYGHDDGEVEVEDGRGGAGAHETIGPGIDLEESLGARAGGPSSTRSDVESYGSGLSGVDGAASFRTESVAAAASPGSHHEEDEWMNI